MKVKVIKHSYFLLDCSTFKDLNSKDMRTLLQLPCFVPIERISENSILITVTNRKTLED